ncbi:MAG: hypothetical protein WC686_00815 [Candidatus Shapirobacteria bacterium]|jgi:hypothetical protein
MPKKTTKTKDVEVQSSSKDEIKDVALKKLDKVKSASGGAKKTVKKSPKPTDDISVETPDLASPSKNNAKDEVTSNLNPLLKPPLRSPKKKRQLDPHVPVAKNTRLPKPRLTRLNTIP